MESQQKPHVCRRLVFEEEENGNDAASPSDIDVHYIDSLEEEMRRRDLQAAIELWNFDFQNDVPLEGQWEWEPVLQAEPRDEQTEPRSETDQGA